jgi:glycosyltransferase involved in cell wall biosynthesis
MNNSTFLSIIVNNYNYARFVSAAVSSALEQDASRTELVVVDDGSTDNSREVLAALAERATIVLKSNGGQASALNAGFSRARGEWIIFLDADDVLLDDCAYRLAAAVAPRASKITWSMPIIGPTGELCSGTAPVRPPAAGDLRQDLIDKGPLAFDFAPCSGNAWSRNFLEKVFPIPEPPFRHGADGYLIHLSPLHGESVLSPEPLSAYRMHGDNFLAAKDQFEMRDELRERYPMLCDMLAENLARAGLPFDRAKWRYEYWDRLDELEAAILKSVPEHSPMILVDGKTLNVGSHFQGRPCRSLLVEDDQYQGLPADGEAAVDRVRALARRGAQYLVIIWHSSWWFDCYPEFKSYLADRATLLHRSVTVTIFRLDESAATDERAHVA